MGIGSGVLGLESVVERQPDLLATPVDEELIILNVATGRYITLDNIGRCIWEAVEAPVRVDDLIDTLDRAYAGDRDVIAAQTITFLKQMLDEALIRII